MGWPGDPRNAGGAAGRDHATKRMGPVAVPPNSATERVCLSGNASDGIAAGRDRGPLVDRWLPGPIHASIDRGGRHPVRDDAADLPPHAARTSARRLDLARLLIVGLLPRLHRNGRPDDGPVGAGSRLEHQADASVSVHDVSGLDAPRLGTAVLLVRPADHQPFANGDGDHPAAVGGDVDGAARWHVAGPAPVATRDDVRAVGRRTGGAAVTAVQPRPKRGDLRHDKRQRELVVCQTLILGLLVVTRSRVPIISGAKGLVTSSTTQNSNVDEALDSRFSAAGCSGGPQNRCNLQSLASLHFMAIRSDNGCFSAEQSPIM